MTTLAGQIDRYSVTISGANKSFTGSDFPLVGRLYRVDYKTNTTAGSPGFVDILESGTNQVLYRDFGIASGTDPIVNYPRASAVDSTINGTVTGSVELPLAFGPLIFRNSGGTWSAGSEVAFTVFWLK